MRDATFKLHYRPHTGQQEVINGIFSSKADIITIDASRGWGKTLFATGSLVIPVLLRTPGAQCMWVAPNYKIAKAPIDDVWYGIDENSGKRYVPQFDEKTGFQFWEYMKGDGELHLFNNSKLFLRSAENPTSIVSKGYNIIVIDEAALISKEVFMQSILPTARKKGCKIILISTPRGRNWFYQFYLEGQNASKPEYVSFKQPWWKRPDYPEVLKRLMKDMPTYLKAQEFDAEFIEDGSGTFKGLDKIFKGPLIEYPDSQQTWSPKLDPSRFNSENFVIAVDFAKSVDFTVITIMSLEKKEVVYYKRLNKTDYKIVLEQLKILSNDFNGADVIYDATGVGQGLQDFLSSSFNAHPFVFTNQSKNELINKLIVASEYSELTIPNIQTIRDEFELFTFEITKTGKISYNAPDGKHDDCVISIALANWYASENAGRGEVHTINNFITTVTDLNRPRTFLDYMKEDND